MGSDTVVHEYGPCSDLTRPSGFAAARAAPVRDRGGRPISLGQYGTTLSTWAGKTLPSQPPLIGYTDVMALRLRHSSFGAGNGSKLDAAAPEDRVSKMGAYARWRESPRRENEIYHHRAVYRGPKNKDTR